jgi:HEAT repeat protein
MTVVAGIVIVLFAWAVALALVAVWLRLLSARQQRRRLRVEHAWRGPVDALILDGVPLPAVPEKERAAVLDLLLRYRALLRGPDAARITDYLEGQGYVQSAVEGLRSRNRWRRAESAVLLGRMRSDAAVAALVDHMSDESDNVRMVAARSLAAIGDPAAVQALTHALADPSRWTATSVAADLVEMGPAAVPTLIEIASGAGSGLPGAHEAAVTAVRVLGEIRDTRAARVLAELLDQGQDLNVRARAAAALGAVGGPLAPPALRAALEDPAWQVRAQAASSLGALGDRDSVPALSAAVEDADWWVRRNCAEALAALGEPGRRALVALSASSDRYVRDRCAAELEALDRPRQDARGHDEPDGRAGAEPPAGREVGA